MNILGLNFKIGYRLVYQQINGLYYTNYTESVRDKKELIRLIEHRKESHTNFKIRTEIIITFDRNVTEMEKYI